MADLNALLDQIPVGDIAKQLGIDEDVAEAAVKQVLPGLVGGLAANAKRDDKSAETLEQRAQAPQQGDRQVRQGRRHRRRREDRPQCLRGERGQGRRQARRRQHQERRDRRPHQAGPADRRPDRAVVARQPVPRRQGRDGGPGRGARRKRRRAEASATCSAGCSRARRARRSRATCSAACWVPARSNTSQHCEARGRVDPAPAFALLADRRPEARGRASAAPASFASVASAAVSVRSAARKRSASVIDLLPSGTPGPAVVVDEPRVLEQLARALDDRVQHIAGRDVDGHDERQVLRRGGQGSDRASRRSRSHRAR